MKKLLRFTLWLSLFTLLSGVVKGNAQDVKWTTLEVTKGQLNAAKIPDGTENLKLVGTIVEKDFTQLQKLKPSLIRIDLSGLEYINNSKNKRFPAQSLRDYAKLQEVTIPSFITTFAGAPFKGSNAIRKIILLNPKTIVSGSSVLPGFWGFDSKSAEEIKAITLQVPQGSIDYYSKTAPWNAFTVIESSDSAPTPQPQEETVKVGFSLYNAGKISVIDKETQKEIQIIGNACKAVVGHTLIINGEGQDGMKFVKGSFAKPYQSPSFFEQLPIEIAVPKEGLNIMLRFGHIIEFGVRGEGGTITAQKTEEETDEFDDTEEVTSKISSGDSFIVGDVTKVTFQAAPKDGYLIKAWYLNGEIQEGKESSFTVKAPKNSIKVEVEFEENKPQEETANVGFSLYNAGKISVIDKETQKEIKIIGNVCKTVVGHTLIINGEGQDGMKFVKGSFAKPYQSPSFFEQLPIEIAVPKEGLNIMLRFGHIIEFGVRGEGGTITAQKTEEETDEFDDTEEVTSTILSGDSFIVGDVTKVTFQAAPKDGYLIKAWYLNGEIQEGKESSFTVKAPKNSIKVEVEFEAIPIKHFAVSLSATPMKGAKELWIAQATNKNDNFVKIEGLSSDLKEGMSIEFNLSVNKGYVFDGFYIGSDKQVSEGEQSKGFRFVIDRLDKATSVIAKMNAIITFAVEGDNNGSLTAQIDDQSIESGSGIESGKSILLTATPNDKFIVKRWIVDGKELTLKDGSPNTEQTINLTMGEDPKDVKVEFVAKPKKKYQIVATTSDEELGSLSIFDITSGDKNEVANESSLEEGTELLFVLDLEDNVKVDTVTVNNQKGINLDEKMSFKINLNDTNCKDGKLIIFAKLINTESSSAVMNETKVYAIENEVYIETAKSTSYQVFTLGGKKIKQGIANTNESFRLHSGVYIVIIDNKAFKLLVK